MIYGGNVEMARGSNYRVKLRRRREGKTDYQARKAMVISGKPRLVTRISLKNVTAQIVIAKKGGDQVLAAANSRELVKTYGWKAPTSNSPAAYLTGLLCGLKAKAAGVQEAILDIGLVVPTKGAKVFVVLSGVVDAGVNVPHSEEKLVKERVKGDHIAKYAKSLGSGSEDYKARFSQYTAQSVAPEKIAEHFSKVKADLLSAFKGGAKPVEVAPEPVPKVAAPKVEPKAEPKAEPKVKAKAAKAPKAEAKAEPAPKVKVAKKAPKAKAAKEKVPKEKVVKAKAAPKKKAPKEKAPKKGEEKA
jgi:large subunit ribosomal protein L18